MTEKQPEKNKPVEFTKILCERMKIVSLFGRIAVFHKGLGKTIFHQEER